MTVKDSVAVLDAKTGAARPGARGDAVGAEIPVTIHASRTTQGMGKNLPSIHEETKTVIVLQQGAVVRLTASLTPGETVVLTNRVTGADVLCHVGNVKTQPGIQHYVDLEFIQRAPGFWGAVVPSQTPATSVQSAPIPEAPAAAPVPSLPPAAAIVPPPVAVPAPTVIAMPPPQALSLPAPVAHSQPAAETLQPAPLADPVAVPWKTPQASPVTPIRPPSPHRGTADPAFGPIGSEAVSGSSSGAQQGLLVAAAALLLVLGGAFGGHWFFSQRSTVPNAPSPQQAMNVPQVQATPDLTQTSAVVIAPAPATLTTASAEPRADIIVESRPMVEGAASRIQPPPVAATRAPAVRRSSVPIGQLKAPKAKVNPARVDSTEPPPMMIGAVSNLSDGGTGGTLLVGEATGPAPPPVSSRPAVGGQLQPPQVISSPAAVYPQAARMQNLQGVVVLDVLVDETGKVVETAVIAGPQLLVSAAQQSVQNWKYRPAQLNGKPISVHTRVNVRFSLQ